MMEDTLKNQLEAWDGIHMNYLEKIYHECLTQNSFFQEIIQLIIDTPDLQTAATWLIKHHYDQKKELENTMLSPLLKASKDFEDWGAQLHILQILPKLILEKEVLPYIEELARKGLASDKKFVRTWAYQGLFEVSKYIPELKEEVLFVCQRAMDIESASVKARVRKILKQIEK